MTSRGFTGISRKEETSVTNRFDHLTGRQSPKTAPPKIRCPTCTEPMVFIPPSLSDARNSALFWAGIWAGEFVCPACEQTLDARLVEAGFYPRLQGERPDKKGGEM